MRGSPLVRTALVSVLLFAAAFGLFLLNSDRGLSPEPQVVETSPDSSTTIGVPFVLTLSHLPSSVQLGSFLVEPANDQLKIYAGMLDLKTDDPLVEIAVEWQDSQSGTRFAKLALEAPGQPTLTHYFESIGNLSDIWEPEWRH